MITYISTNNSKQYQNLFNKAEEVLKKAANAGILDLGIDDVNNLEISTLNQYFAYLQDLITASNSEEEVVTRENLKTQFLRLPLDEELFEINANTRTISVPRNFSSNGVGVQGDETAEILYFSIDRYFDHMDLANEDMQIVIQWETKDKNKETITGISPNFGKDIETIPGKIIFGWPIYSELTESATPIKFAVRFFSVDTNTKTLNYSLATLPAEISVGSTIDYDIANNAVQEVDRSNMIINRIKNVGIYEPSIPTPALATISTPLFVNGKTSDEKVVDLPANEDDGVILKISARPTDFGTVVYSWKKFSYDPITGEYAQTPSSDFDGEINNGVYEEVTEINDDLYYKISSPQDVTPITYSQVVVDDILKKVNDEYIYEDGVGFMQTDGSYIKLFKRFSIAKVNSVGIYTVNVGVRNGVNTVATEMSAEDGIKIPGPLKPIINTPENTTEDGVTHIIAENGTTILSASAQKREEDENAVVSISYDWKKLINGVEESLDGDSVETSNINVFALGQNDHGYVPADGNREDSLFNQDQITIVQKGTNIIVYQTGEELRSYASTNASQGEGKWLGFDIDTHEETIEGLTWGGSYILNSDDVVESASVGLGAGHIIFWAKAEDLAAEGGRQIQIDDTELTITYVTELPSTEEYTFNEDKNEVIITGLPSSGLDEKYVAAVTAERNKVKTVSNSGIYRVTNAPEKPILKRFDNRGNRITSDYIIEENLVPFNMKRNGVYRTLSFSVVPPQQSDNLSYIWMRLKAEDNIVEDWENNSEKLQIDLDNFLSDLFEDKPGEADTPVNGIYELIKLTDLGEIVEDADNGPSLTFSDETPTGIYYCIVVNELNNYRVANVTPFYSVTNN